MSTNSIDCRWHGLQMAAFECSVAASRVDGHMEMDAATRTLWGPELGKEDRFGGISGTLKLDISDARSALASDCPVPAWLARVADKVDKVKSEVTLKSYTVFVDPETGALSEQYLLEKGIEFQIAVPILSILVKNQAEPFELLRMKTPDERRAGRRCRLELLRPRHPCQAFRVGL